VGCHPLRDTPDPTDLEDHGRAKADAAEAGTPQQSNRVSVFRFTRARVYQTVPCFKAEWIWLLRPFGGNGEIRRAEEAHRC
jgi:hypothetical protein